MLKPFDFQRLPRASDFLLVEHIDMALFHFPTAAQNIEREKTAKRSLEIAQGAPAGSVACKLFFSSAIQAVTPILPLMSANDVMTLHTLGAYAESLHFGARRARIYGVVPFGFEKFKDALVAVGEKHPDELKKFKVARIKADAAGMLEALNNLRDGARADMKIFHDQFITERLDLSLPLPSAQPNPQHGLGS